MTETSHGPGSSSVVFLLGEINSKVDLLLLAHTDQEGRIRSLERTRAYGLGVAAAVSAIVGFFSTHLAFFFKGQS